MIKRIRSILILLLCISLLSSCAKKEPEQFFERTAEKSFIDVIHDAEFAITENNFRITNRLHIGAAIQKRGNEGFPKNEVILFCNLTTAEEMLKIEKRYIHYCPYKITISEYGTEIIVGTRLLPENTKNKKMDEIAIEINKLLRSMVEYAAADDLFMFDDSEKEN